MRRCWKKVVPTEVVAEIVYVLEGVYKVKRETIVSTLIEFFQCENIAGIV